MNRLPAQRPPRWEERFLELLLPWQYREEHLGDLHEGFQRRVEDPRAARAWYRRQVLRSIPAALRLCYQTRKDENNGEMQTMEIILRDIRYALRSLRKSPAFAIVSTVTLALAIGVNTSVFSLVSVIIFADLPMQDTETVALVRGVNPELGVEQGSVSPADYFDLLERSRSFQSLAALTEGQWVLTGEDHPTRVEGLQVTAGLSETWRLPPVLGRAFAEGEDREGAERVVMLTHGFWQDKYGSREDVLGETINLDGIQHTIVGVANPKLEWASFRLAQVIVPLVLNHAEPNRAVRYLFVSGRLAAGVTHAMATEEVRRIGLDLENEYAEQNLGWGLWSAPVMESLIDPDGRTLMLLLQLTVGMVILIACANVANMLLARGTARAREFAVRVALGAGRGRLLRQLLIESLVISLSAAALGLGFAAALNRALILVSAGTEELFLMAALNGPVLAFTLLVSLVAPLAFGLFPALRASSAGPGAALGDGRSGDGGRAGKRVRSGLVTAQVSLALTLMILATLLTRSVINLSIRPLGFDGADIMTFELALPEAAYEEEEARLRFFTRVREAVAEIPGLGPVELTSSLPGVEPGRRRSVELEGLEQPEGRAAPAVLMLTVSTGFFELLGLHIERGRGFLETDNAESFPVAVVSHEIAGHFWPNENAVGRRFRVPGDEQWLQVVGVVGDVRGGERDRQARNVYLPQAQDARQSLYLVSRSVREPSDVAPAIREAIWSVDPQQPVDGIRTLERANYERSASNYATVTLFLVFAVFALLMAAIGIYGVMAYAVSQRTKEIGLRMALGAEAATVRWMVVSQGARLVGAGIVLGLGASFVLSRLLGNIVFGITTTDRLTFIGMPVLLALVALTANLIPARRATKLDPASTLRGD